MHPVKVLTSARNVIKFQHLYDASQRDGNVRGPALHTNVHLRHIRRVLTFIKVVLPSSCLTKDSTVKTLGTNTIQMSSVVESSSCFIDPLVYKRPVTLCAWDCVRGQLAGAGSSCGSSQVACWAPDGSQVQGKERDLP